jgi:hypothetical protein
MTTRILGVLALAGGIPLGVTTTGFASNDVPITITGCVMPGVSKDSFLLTNTTIDAPMGTPTDAYYRFDSTKKLKSHVGHRVEVRGEADLDDLDKGKVKVRTDDDGKVTTSITSERQTVTLNGRVFAGTMGATRIDASVPTYGFEVKSVQRISGNCAHSGAAP